MASEFVRLSVFREDYWTLVDKFGTKETRTPQGELVSKALHHIDELESELGAINKVLQENIK